MDCVEANVAVIGPARTKPHVALTGWGLGTTHSLIGLLGLYNE